MAETNYKISLPVDITLPDGTSNLSNTVSSETSFGISPNAGVSTKVSRGDHTHGTPTDPVPAHASLTGNTHGVSTSGFEDKTNKGVPNGYPNLNANTKVPTMQLGTGTPDNTTFLRGDQTWAVPPGDGGGGGTPSNTVISETSFGVLSNPGSSIAYARGDHTHGSPTDPIPPHASIKTNVHGFDASGNAPVQQHGLNGSVHIGSLGIGQHGSLNDGDHTGNLSGNARVNIKKAGTSVGTRRGINFIEGSNITMNITDDPTNEKINVTINSTGGGSLSPATTVKSETVFGLSAAVGTSLNYAREDHTHGSPPGGGGGGTTIPILASYIIYQSSGTIYAKNGATGTIDYQGTDAATIINQIINSFDISGGPIGGTMFIKEGTYVLNSSIVLIPKVSLIGQGRETIFQRASNSNVNMISFRWDNAGKGYEWGAGNQTVGNFNMLGNSVNGGKGWALYLGGPSRASPDFVRFENIEIIQSNGIGFYYGCYWNQFYNVNIWIGGSTGETLPTTCIDLSLNSDYPNANYFYGCKVTGGIYNPSTGGVTLYGTGIKTHGGGNTFTNVDMSSLATAFTGSGYRNSLISPWFELNTTAIDATGMYNLIVMNPRTSMTNGESGNIIEGTGTGQTITWIGNSAWKYGGNDQIAEPMIKSAIMQGKYMALTDVSTRTVKFVYISNGQIIVSNTQPSI